MSTRKKAVTLCLILVALSAWAGGTLVLESLAPELPKKAPEGYSLQGEVHHYRDSRLDVQVAYLAVAERVRYFAMKELPDPFATVLPAENLILIRMRLENLQKEGAVEFSPTATMLGESLAFDDTFVYQFLYKEKDADAKLSAAGKTMYLRHLSLPPGTWIERLLAFQYDDPYSAKRLILQIGGVSTGQEAVDLAFSFKTTFKKVKEKSK